MNASWEGCGGLVTRTPDSTRPRAGRRARRQEHVRRAACLAARGPAPAASTYLATSETNDQEMAARVAAHRAARPAAWVTLECPLELAAAVRSTAAATSAGGRPAAGSSPGAGSLGPSFCSTASRSGSATSCSRPATWAARRPRPRQLRQGVHPARGRGGGRRAHRRRPRRSARRPARDRLDHDRRLQRGRPGGRSRVPHRPVSTATSSGAPTGAWPRPPARSTCSSPASRSRSRRSPPTPFASEEEHHE